MQPASLHRHLDRFLQVLGDDRIAFGRVSNLQHLFSIYEKPAQLERDGPSGKVVVWILEWMFRLTATPQAEVGEGRDLQRPS